jgi:hypothetical protein
MFTGAGSCVAPIGVGQTVRTAGIGFAWFQQTNNKFDPLHSESRTLVGMRRFAQLAAVSFVAVFYCGVIFASAVVPLDTFPSINEPFGPDAGLFARASDGQEIGIQFSVSAAGRVTSIETGLYIGSGICGWKLGITRADFLGSSIQPGFYEQSWNAGAWVHSINLSQQQYSDQFYCNDSSTKVSGDAPVTLSGLDWCLDAGDDIVIAAWRAVNELKFAVRSMGETGYWHGEPG